MAPGGVGCPGGGDQVGGVAGEVEVLARLSGGDFAIVRKIAGHVHSNVLGSVHGAGHHVGEVAPLCVAHGLGEVPGGPVGVAAVVGVCLFAGSRLPGFS